MKISMKKYDLQNVFSSLAGEASLSGQLWPGMVEPDRLLSMGEIEMFDI